MIYILIFVGFISLCYVLFIAYITIGFFRCRVSDVGLVENDIKVSVVVALKNEERNVTGLMDSLLGQSYAMEIILVDDDSNDSTFVKLTSIVRDYMALSDNRLDRHSIKIISSKGGKKAAVATGVKESTGSLIITTDADCVADKDWVKSIVGFYKSNGQPKMILGAVRMKGEGIFADLQQLEFATLIASSCGAASMGRPIMCNAANMAFRKDVYHLMDLGNNVSGDDMFLMQGVKRRFSSSDIKFIKSESSTVDTSPSLRFNDFVMQRIRWTSKAGGYRDFDIIVSAMIVFLFCCSIVIMLLSSVFVYDYLLLSATLFIIKLLVDLPIVIGVCKSMKICKVMKYYLPVQILYVFYITFIPVISLFVKVRWKS